MEFSASETQMSNIVYLHGDPPPIAHFLRVGTSGHRRLEQLLAADQLPYSRFVGEAGVFLRQKDLVEGLRQAGHELVLDTNVAELSVVGRYKGAAQGAPWADPDRVLSEAHLRAGANEFDLIGQIARFAVENGINRVMAPAHYLAQASDRWFEIDLGACTRLRRVLDQEGGADIAIDYPLIVSNAAVNDATQRRAFITSLEGRPVNSVWLRVSGFGGGATAPALRKYIAALRDFHELGRPIIADCVGGLSAQAILSFGAASGIAHGLAEKERFDTSYWHKPPPPPDPEKNCGGNAYAVLLPGIDRLLKPAQAQALIETAGGRRILACNDRRCCPRGFDDTIADPKGHYLRQRAWQCEAISSIPELRRVQDFLDRTLADADRTARQAARLRVVDSKLKKIVEDNAWRVDRLRVVLESLQQTEAISTKAEAFPVPIPLKAARKRNGL
jgi:hypothetical protein